MMSSQMNINLAYDQQEEVDTVSNYGVIIKECSEGDIDHIFDFQNMIYGYLHEDEKGFFLPKTKSFLKDHFNAGSRAITAVHNDKVVGQALIVFPTESSPKTGMTDMDIPHATETLSIIQGLSVDPKARGLNVGNILIEAWLKVSIGNGRMNVLAETSQDNPYSWKLFEKKGVIIVSEGIDNDDGTLLYNHYCELKR